MPQLQIKVPTLRRWGKKMAVVVDRPFFNSIGTMSQIEHISNGDIVWFIVKLEEDVTHGFHRIVGDDIHVTTLEHATDGLTGGHPVSKEVFEDNELPILIHTEQIQRSSGHWRLSANQSQPR